MTYTHSSAGPIKHGTYRCYIDRNCRRPECREAWRVYGADRRRQIAYGRLKVDHYVSGSLARAHVERLRHHGFSIKAISRECGVSRGTISRILAGHRTRTSTQNKILAVLPGPPDVTGETPGMALIDGAGTRRRLRALVVQGWTAVRLAEQVGCTPESLRQSLTKDESERTVARFAVKVRNLYEQLWDQEPACVSRYEQAQANRVRNKALDRGWAPPMAWDEESIDNPAASPGQWREIVDLGSARRRIHLEDLQDCASWGLTIVGTGNRLGVTQDAIEACARRAGRRDVLQRMRANSHSHVA